MRREENETYENILTRQQNTPKFVFPAKAGIQADTICRIKPGMTGFAYLIAGLITAYLEQHEIPTFTKKGRWHAQTVHRLYQDYDREF